MIGDMLNSLNLSYFFGSSGSLKIAFAIKPGEYQNQSLQPTQVRLTGLMKLFKNVSIASASISGMVTETQFPMYSLLGDSKSFRFTLGFTSQYIEAFTIKRMLLEAV